MPEDKSKSKNKNKRNRDGDGSNDQPSKKKPDLRSGKKDEDGDRSFKSDRNIDPDFQLFDEEGELSKGLLGEPGQQTSQEALYSINCVLGNHTGAINKILLTLQDLQRQLNDVEENSKGARSQADVNSAMINRMSAATNGPSTTVKNAGVQHSNDLKGFAVIKARPPSGRAFR